MLIDSNIPVPKKGPYGAMLRYPFPNMSIGDSFRVENSQELSCRTAGCAYGKRHNMKFTVRKYEDAYRCWRIA